MDYIALAYGLIAFAFSVTIPGYFVTLAFFPSKKHVDAIERLTFSIVFSISIIPVLILLENQLLSVPINFFSIIATILIVILFSLIVYLVRSQKLSVPSQISGVLGTIPKEDVVELVPRKFVKK
jgi:uncharacterized membrane protein